MVILVYWLIARELEAGILKLIVSVPKVEHRDVLVITTLNVHLCQIITTALLRKKLFKR